MSSERETYEDAMEQMRQQEDHDAWEADCQEEAYAKEFLTKRGYTISKTTTVEDMKNGEPFTVEVPKVFRWKAYSPKSQQFKKGILGRVQEHNGYGWENSEYTEEYLATLNTRPKPDVDKGARAIYDQRMKNEVFGIDTPAFDDIPDNFKEMFMLEAEAAIKAGSE